MISLCVCILSFIIGRRLLCPARNNLGSGPVYRCTVVVKDEVGSSTPALRLERDRGRVVSTRPPHRANCLLSNAASNETDIPSVPLATTIRLSIK